jgi:hypothetical protein
MQRIIHWLTSLALAFAVSACGGGGGSDGGGTPGLLAGDPAAPAVSALAAVEPTPAEPQDVVGRTLLTRISLVLKPDASVADVNAAAQRVGATAITFSDPGSIFLTFAVPRQDSPAALDALAGRLDGEAGILFASAGREADRLELPESGGVTASIDDLDHLLVTRFPAAWNVRRAAENGCAGRKVTVIVPDFYFGTPANFSDQLTTQGEFAVSFDRTLAEPTAIQTPDPHGYQVVATLAAKFDAQLSTGANPAPGCLTIRGVNGTRLTTFELVRQTIRAVRRETGPVIVSSSFGYLVKICGSNGDSTCAAADIAGAALSIKRNMFARFAQGILWAEFAMQPEVVNRMLVVQAAGNSADQLLGRVYAGLRSAQLGSPFAIATTLANLDSVAADPTLWTPVVQPGAPIIPVPPELFLDARDLGALKTMRDFRVTNPVTDRNLLLVGAATNRPQLADLRRLEMSNDGATLFAIGENVSTVDFELVDGTSFAAPQVAGLASYLWLLEPSLATQPAAATIALLRATAQGNALLGNVVDAYATVLSLDKPEPVTPASARVRLAILDVNGDGVFNLADLQAFHGAYIDSGLVLEPTVRDYSRFDLNGDGFTGGTGEPRERQMDLDPTGSTRFGAPVLSEVFVEVGAVAVTFNELAITDARALCFYANTALYTGDDLASRDELLRDLCARPVSGTSVRFDRVNNVATEISLRQDETPSSSAVILFQALGQSPTRDDGSNVLPPLPDVSLTKTDTFTASGTDAFIGSYSIAANYRESVSQPEIDADRFSGGTFIADASCNASRSPGGGTREPGGPLLPIFSSGQHFTKNKASSRVELGVLEGQHRITITGTVSATAVGLRIDAQQPFPGDGFASIEFTNASSGISIFDQSFVDGNDLDEAGAIGAAVSSPVNMTFEVGPGRYRFTLNAETVCLISDKTLPTTAQVEVNVAIVRIQ